ncbi:MAG: Holliday junction resolvase RuvX [Halanaerobiaceae bacterium]|nr:Holliday junction resolvase RuvX [Halanaerobiaceae bacterium]
MRCMGLDYGDKTIGIAISDALGWTAQPKAVIRRKNLTDDFAILKEYIDKYDVQEVVVGLPINMDGSEGIRVRRTEEFVNFLRKRLDIPVKVWDERLTTRQAENILLEADLSRSRRKEVIDQIAASIILQNYLDAKYYKGDELNGK